MNNYFARLKIRTLLAFKPVVFFNLLNQLNWYQKTLQKWVENNHFSKKSTILEIGCATAVLSRSISALGHQITAVDLSEKMIKVAKANNPEIPFYVADVNNLPFKNASFDVVISASLLNIVSDKEKALLEMIRVCKNGGTISVLVPLASFSDVEMDSLRSSLQITGFSSEALRAWHKLAPKMSILEMKALFEKKGLQIQKSEKYLNDMVFSMTAISYHQDNG